MKATSRTSMEAQRRSVSGTPWGPLDHVERAPSTPNSGERAKIPPQWAWHYRTLLRLREPLLRAHLEHTSAATEPLESGGIDAADVAQDQLDRDMLWAELAVDDMKLFEIDCALQRIRDGVYGFCEETGQPIPADRLRAVPWTRYCRAIVERDELERRAAAANIHG